MAGFTPVTFGEHRLRTETAALYAVQAFHILNAP
ncbi:MAG: 16S rRNA (uracil(1498)-N(3))-methyltransferase [Bacteroidota bacterium]|nr:16S rRNA (uracil(1498)-N(3))-methyltransferase [Bacteroidota bacterium]